MADEAVFQDATLLDRFVAAISRDDESAAQRLAGLAPGPENLGLQRDEAWTLLSAGTEWAARALESAGVPGTNDQPIRDSDEAFERAQHLDGQLWKLSQQGTANDAVALVVEKVKQACYAGADLGPLVGGLIAGIRTGTASGASVEREPNPADLQAIGSELGDALRRLGELRLVDPVQEAVDLRLPETA
jgi:hypothetical protein